jgi:hypothetical protein
MKISGCCSIPTWMTVANECEDLTLKKWNGRLGSADVFTKDHCWVISWSLRIN